MADFEVDEWITTLYAALPDDQKKFLDVQKTQHNKGTRSQFHKIFLELKLTTKDESMHFLSAVRTCLNTVDMLKVNYERWGLHGV